MAEAAEDEMSEELRLTALSLQLDDAPAPEPQTEPQEEPEPALGAAVGDLPQPSADMPITTPPSPHIEGRGVTYAFLRRLTDARITPELRERCMAGSLAYYTQAVARTQRELEEIAEEAATRAGAGTRAGPGPGPGTRDG